MRRFSQFFFCVMCAFVFRQVNAADDKACAPPLNGSTFFPVYALDPDARSSRLLNLNDSETKAFRDEVRSTCLHIKAQVEVLGSGFPESCNKYADFTDTSGEFIDPRRCLASASLLNFRRELRYLL